MGWTNRVAAESPVDGQSPLLQAAPSPRSVSLRETLDLVAQRHRRRRNRQLASWTRRTAQYVPSRGGLRTRSDLLIADRVMVARWDLMQIAELLEQLDDPDRAALTELRSLLSDGCSSPLYNSGLHVSELRAALYYVKKRLAIAFDRAASPASRSGPDLVASPEARTQ